ncbi:SPASM domain-containing protein [Streptococcus dysgalactiae]|nr:SPASM domain-containing protein [Streptococcus dysgalactiae]
MLNNPDLQKGCDNLFTFIGVDPKGEYIGCCGLTMRYIPSMHLGNINSISLSESYFKQYNDFLN